LFLHPKPAILSRNHNLLDVVLFAMKHLKIFLKISKTFYKELLNI